MTSTDLQMLSTRRPLLSGACSPGSNRRRLSSIGQQPPWVCVHQSWFTIASWKLTIKRCMLTVDRLNRRPLTTRLVYSTNTRCWQRPTRAILHMRSQIAQGTTQHDSLRCSLSTTMPHRHCCGALVIAAHHQSWRSRSAGTPDKTASAGWSGTSAKRWSGGRRCNCRRHSCCRPRTHRRRA